MQTPTAALAWELWRRNRLRLIGMFSMFLGFAFIYPKLCAMAGVDLANSGDLVSFGASATQGGPRSQFVATIHVLYIIFLAGSPVVALFLSLLCLTWMFTFVEFHPNDKNPVRFPDRLFMLPISNFFLFSLLLGGGVAALALLFAGWHFFVPMQRVLQFGAYEKCISWLTLLALAQGITWALAGWPNTRLCVLMLVLFAFLFSPAWPRFLVSPIVMPTLFLLGAVLARVGLEKMRHGQWQGWTWPRPMQALLARAPLRGPKHFASPAQAQLWFEWRRLARPLTIALATFALVPAFLLFLARRALGLGPLDSNTLAGFAIILAIMPPAIHFFFFSVPALNDRSFPMLRPLTNGQMVLATLKAAAVGTALSWVAVLLAAFALSRLGDYKAAGRDVALSLGQWVGIVWCLIFLTWRMVPAELCFVLSGRRWVANMPWLKVIGFWVGIFLLTLGGENEGLRWFDSMIFSSLPLALLLVSKLILAWVSFRTSLQRHLLAPSAALNYLAVWSTLVASSVMLVVFLFHHSAPQLVRPLSLAAALLVPLARVGFAPLTLAQSRHA
jgi:hypothetical protein